MKKIKGYRIYKELTDNNGNVVHKRPLAWTGSQKNACTHARVWGGTVYTVYEDGTEERA